MNITVFLISLYIFIDTLAYGIYEIRKQNKFGGTLVILLSIFMILLVNYFTIRFN